MQSGDQVWLQDGQAARVVQMLNCGSICNVRVQNGSTVTYGVEELLTEEDRQWLNELEGCLDRLPQPATGDQRGWPSLLVP